MTDTNTLHLISLDKECLANKRPIKWTTSVLYYLATLTSGDEKHFG